MKFRSLVRTYMSHRHYLKVHAHPSPFCQEPACPVWAQGAAGREEALSTQEETVGLR